VALFAAVLAAVIWLSLEPHPPSLQVSNIDKVQHFAAYASLAALAHLASRGRFWRSALGLVALGIGLEFAQAAEALGRQASVLDGLANGAGVLLVSLAWPRR
jgi:VanZ family protein